MKFVSSRERKGGGEKKTNRALRFLNRGEKKKKDGRARKTPTSGRKRKKGRKASRFLIGKG